MEILFFYITFITRFDFVASGLETQKTVQSIFSVLFIFSGIFFRLISVGFVLCAVFKLFCRQNSPVGQNGTGRCQGDKIAIECDQADKIGPAGSRVI
jgi:hypothetical protein